ncbi:MAG TPA: FAD-dependent monooxygenase [Rhodanobacteraceae bacterium]|nr:FAD-dependent monooxygenase [Rhodanobacteraceae bacterium]
MDTDVLIVGAGPTGLMLANQLARRGVRHLLIDRHGGPARETRALGVQARTLEIYQKLGIVDRALELGTPGYGANLWANGVKKGHVPLGDAGREITPYPYILILGQDDNERIMGERLTALGGAVQWNTELTALEQRTDRVAATLKMPDGATRTIEAAWVAGCDGARSAVRELNALDFPGAPYEHVFFVADVEMTGTMVPDEVNVYLWKSGFHLFFPMRGADHWRIVGIVPKELRGNDKLAFDAVVPSMRNEAGAALAFKSCSWFSTYRIHHRAAAEFRKGRCFVLGDAAHIHSPVGAQGMNTGLQDAYNLAWKLALVVQGKADAALIDSYAAERMPVAQRLLRSTDEGFKFIVSDSAFAGLMRTQVVARLAGFAMKFRRVQLTAFRTVSQTGIEYRKSPLSDGTLPDGAPQAGDRFPWLKLALGSGGPVEDLFATLDDLRFHLFAFGQAAPAGLPDFGGLVATHEVPADAANDAALAHAKIPQPSFYLVRPDGYVGLCGATLDAESIESYFRETLRVRDR